MLGADRAADELLGDAVRLDHPALAFGGAAAVAAHGRHDERPGAEPLRCSTIARVIAAMPAIPRLPAVMATVWPGWTFRPNSRRAKLPCRLRPARRRRDSASNVWRRRKIWGKEAVTGVTLGVYRPGLRGVRAAGLVRLSSEQVPTL